MTQPLFAVITVSDRCSRGEATDTAGPSVADLLREHWPTVQLHTDLVPDEQDQITAAILNATARNASLVVTVGGTGLGPRDVTPEATKAVIEREAQGLAEAMRSRGAEVYRYSWLSRAIAGTRGHTLILNLPGSEKGAVESLSAVLDLIQHALELLDGSNQHPAS